MQIRLLYHHIKINTICGWNLHSYYISFQINIQNMMYNYVFSLLASFLVYKSEVRNSSSCDGEYTPTSHPKLDLNWIIINDNHIVKMAYFCNF